MQGIAVHHPPEGERWQSGTKTACSGKCHLKDWRGHHIATLFGGVTVPFPRFRCTACERIETSVGWPSRCRSTPELDELQAHLSALMTYRVASGVLQHLLPIDAGRSPETLRLRHRGGELKQLRILCDVVQ